METAQSQLHRLLSLRLGERLEAIATDLERKPHQFAAIDAFDLAEALDVPTPERPGNEWSFTSFACIESIENFAQRESPASEIVYRIQEDVSEDRFEELRRMSEGLDDNPAPTFEFLTTDERILLERAIAEDQLESNMSNGMNCIARYTITAESGRVLEFEAKVEDDGACITLLTPYDRRAGRFQDLSNCVTEEW